MADAFAEKAAADAEPEPHAVRKYELNFSRMQLIHRRIVCVLKRIVEISDDKKFESDADIALSEPRAERKSAEQGEQLKPSLHNQIKQLKALGHSIGYYKSRGATLLRCELCRKHFPFSRISQAIAKG